MLRMQITAAHDRALSAQRIVAQTFDDARSMLEITSDFHNRITGDVINNIMHTLHTLVHLVNSRLCINCRDWYKMYLRKANYYVMRLLHIYSTDFRTMFDSHAVVGACIAGECRRHPELERRRAGAVDAAERRAARMRQRVDENATDVTATERYSRAISGGKYTNKTFRDVSL